MQLPKRVNNAVIAIWISIAISAFGSLVAMKAGQVSEGSFVFSLLFYGFFCIIPYKIGNRSNATRFVYLVLFIISILASLSGIVKISKIEILFGLIEFLLTVFALFNLFSQESNTWFSKSNSVSH